MPQPKYSHWYKKIWMSEVTSILRSRLCFWSKRSWLKKSEETLMPIILCGTIVSCWPDRPAGFGGGAGFKRSRSERYFVVVQAVRKPDEKAVDKEARAHLLVAHLIRVILNSAHGFEATDTGRNLKHRLQVNVYKYYLAMMSVATLMTLLPVLLVSYQLLQRSKRKEIQELWTW